MYDARFHRHEPHLRPIEQLAELLPSALEDAVVAAVAASRVERPFVVELFPGSERFAPFGRVGGERYRERMVALSLNPEAAVEALVEAEPPDGAAFELVEHLDQDAAQACREITAVLLPYGESDERDRRRVSAMLGELGRELAVRLNRRAWPGSSNPFLVLVEIGEEHARVDPYALAAEAVGSGPVAAFRASLQPTRQAVAPPHEASGDRSALEALLAERGLTAHAHRLAYQVAELGLRARGNRPGALPPRRTGTASAWRGLAARRREPTTHVPRGDRSHRAA